MKTNKRRFLAALTASTLALTPCFAAGMMNAFAAATAGTSTLSITDSDPAAHTYKAYQIITGTQESGKLKDLSWGSAIPSSSRAVFIDDLNTLLGLTGTNVIADDASVQTVAEALTTVPEADYAELAKIVQKYVDDNEAIPMSNSSGTYSATNLADGWYLILDKTSPLVTGNTAEGVRVKSANVLKLVGNTNINAKHSLPTLEKKIVEGTEKVDANTAAIGDVVTYNIEIKVPDVRGYEKYYYVVDDTLSAGLTYNNDMAIRIAGESSDIDPDTDGPTGNSDTEGDYYVKHDGTSIKVVFMDAVNFFKNKTPGTKINLTYTATLNSTAAIDNTGNPNTANLIYSNDPNFDTDGTSSPTTPDEPTPPSSPDSPSVYGETPEDTVITYTTAIRIKKVNQNNAPLTGAKFKLEGTNLNEVKITSAETFAEDASGTYYKLNDGSYTLTPPPTESSNPNYAKYDSENISKRFKKTNTTAGTVVEDATGASPISVEAEVDSSGYITFYGLKPGNYTLTETVIPQGFNGASPETFQLKATPTTSSAAWSFRNVDDTADYTKFTLNGTDSVYEITIQNREGAQLPETGGIGTKLFYVFGSLFVIGGATFMVTKKRVGNSK